MTPWLLCVASLALPAGQHPTPPVKPAEPKVEAKAEPKVEAKAEPKVDAKADAKPGRSSAQPVDAAARILDRLDREFPYKTPETRPASAASNRETRGAPKVGVTESRRPSRLTLSWRITLTWPVMQ